MSNVNYKKFIPGAGVFNHSKGLGVIIFFIAGQAGNLVF